MGIAAPRQVGMLLVVLILFCRHYGRISRDRSNLRLSLDQHYISPTFFSKMIKCTHNHNTPANYNYPCIFLHSIFSHLVFVDSVHNWKV